jgi:hypothetical protein
MGKHKRFIFLLLVPIMFFIVSAMVISQTVERCSCVVIDVILLVEAGIAIGAGIVIAIDVIREWRNECLKK